MHISHTKSFNIHISIALATLAHMINVYEICLNTTHFLIFKLQYFRYCLWTSILDCFGQLVSPPWISYISQANNLNYPCVHQPSLNMLFSIICQYDYFISPTFWSYLLFSKTNSKKCSNDYLILIDWLIILLI